MAHYAFINEDYIVTEVIVGKEESNFDWENHYSSIRGQLCKRTSYNTIGGIHIKGGTPFRKNYAGVGYKYDPNLDAFIPPKTFESWIFNQETCLWDPPIPYPTDNEKYLWNETTISWEQISENN